MKKILVLFLGLMLGFTSVFSCDFSTTDVCDDVVNTVTYIYGETDDIIPVITTDVNDDVEY